MAKQYETFSVAAEALHSIEYSGFVRSSESDSTASRVIGGIESGLTGKPEEVNAFWNWINEKKNKGVIDSFVIKAITAFDKPYMHDWEVPFAVGLVNIYLEDCKRKKNTESWKQKFENSQHQGNVGERNEYFIKMYHVQRIQTNSGDFHIHTFHDRNNNVFTILKPTIIQDIEINDCVLVRGTVKKHTEYYGIKQTQINRHKVLQNVGKKENENV